MNLEAEEDITSAKEDDSDEEVKFGIRLEKGILYSLVTLLLLVSDMEWMIGRLLLLFLLPL